MSEDPTTPAASGGLDTMNPSTEDRPLDAAAVAVKAAGIGRGFVRGSMPDFDIATLPPKNASEGVAERGDGTEVIVAANPYGTLKVVPDGSGIPAVSQQEVDMDKRLSGPQDKSVEMPAGADDELVNEATVAAWPGTLMDEAPETVETKSPETIEPVNSEPWSTTTETATTTPSTASPIGYTTSENPTTTTSSTSELSSTTIPTTSPYTEVPTTTVSTSTPNPTMTETTPSPKILADLDNE